MWRLLVCFISAIFCKRDVVQLECMQVGAAMTATVEAGVIERCNGAVLELVPCSDSIKGPGADPVSHGCCMALSELLLSPECLCYAATISQGFDMKQILGLPAACKFHVKPHQACEGIPIPSYPGRPSEVSAPSSSINDLPPLGFSDEIREEIRKEFRAHQVRLESLKRNP